MTNKTELNDDLLDKIYGGKGIDEDTPICKNFDPKPGQTNGRTCGCCKQYSHGECLKGIK